MIRLSKQMALVEMGFVHAGLVQMGLLKPLSLKSDFALRSLIQAHLE